MPTRVHILTASGFASGLVNTIGVTLIRADGTTHIARSASGITQISAGTGAVVYRRSVTLDDADLPLECRWDDAVNVAVETIESPSAGSGGGGSVSFEKETVTIG
jgi:hypothetical protein